mmetsp:Transcript_10686/g.22692  ORF Transcript_10686/g.22692 Transcript_10686/m.22692 type:complete len:365 (-) Transcript_10686:1963-3057(-)
MVAILAQIREHGGKRIEVTRVAAVAAQSVVGFDRQDRVDRKPHVVLRVRDAFKPVQRRRHVAEIHRAVSVHVPRRKQLRQAWVHLDLANAAGPLDRLGAELVRLRAKLDAHVVHDLLKPAVVNAWQRRVARRVERGDQCADCGGTEFEFVAAKVRFEVVVVQQTVVVRVGRHKRLLQLCRKLLRAHAQHALQPFPVHVRRRVRPRKRRHVSHSTATHTAAADSSTSCCTRTAARARPPRPSARHAQALVTRVRSTARSSSVITATARRELVRGEFLVLPTRALQQLISERAKLKPVPLLADLDDELCKRRKVERVTRGLIMREKRVHREPHGAVCVLQLIHPAQREREVCKRNAAVAASVPRVE